MFDKNIPNNNLQTLPSKFDFEQKEILKLAIKASEEISKLNGLSYLIPNLNLLISPLLTKESVESSAIENINTTTIKVLQAKAVGKKDLKGPEKEVLRYQESILEGFKKMQKLGGISTNLLIDIQSIIEPNKTGIRKIPGTIIADSNGKVLYTPPEGKNNIEKLLTNLENFVNNNEDDINILIKMPVIHYQFESIHPFYDGNGRVGRVLNVLHLILGKKLNHPILFLSEYINKNKQEYYTLLNKIHKTSDYKDFIIYMLKGIIEQGQKTNIKILAINNLRIKIEENISKLNMDYSKITKILFSSPFLTSSNFIEKIGLSRQSGTKYINKLEENNIIETVKIGRNKLIYIKDFIELLS